jgi:predicted RNA methylase
VGAGSLSEGVAALGVDAVPLAGDVARLGVGAGSLSEGVVALGADESALAVESGDIEIKAAAPSAMAET